DAARRRRGGHCPRVAGRAPPPRPQSETIQGQGCAQSPFRPAPPTRRGSRRSPSHRNPMARFWCAPGRSACARPTAKSSRVVMALLLPVSSASFSATNRWAQSRPPPRVAASHPAISSSASCAPDPVPCLACAAGEWDMCRNGRYAERGIKERHGYGAERFRIEPDFAIRIDPALGILGVLLEPASILAKAWDHTERIGHRACAWQPRTLLVTGAGPIGLLAALMGIQRDLDVHVLDHNKGGPKEALVRDLGGPSPREPSALKRLAPDILMECTGAPALICGCLDATAAAGIVCLTGVTEPGKAFDVDIGRLNRTIVLDNNVIFG